MKFPVSVLALVERHRLEQIHACAAAAFLLTDRKPSSHREHEAA